MRPFTCFLVLELGCARNLGAASVWRPPLQAHMDKSDAFAMLREHSNSDSQHSFRTHSANASLIGIADSLASLVQTSTVAGMKGQAKSAPRQNPMGEYQCAVGNLGDSSSNMTTTCLCNGYVKFGYGARWSAWKDVSGSVACSHETFGDPLPGHPKVCMCIPEIYTCATEWSTPNANCSECTMDAACACHGKVRFGYGSNWSSWHSVSGVVACSAYEFGDPSPGHGKICQCKPAASLLELYANNMEDTAIMQSSVITTVTAYFVVYAVCSVTRACRPQIVRQRFESVVSKVQLAPMLCALFFALSKRAETFSKLPPLFSKILVAVCSGAFCCQALFYATSELVAHRERYNVWRTLFQQATILMYGTLGGIIVTAICMKEPEPKHAQSGTIPVAYATLCTIVIGITYFAVHLAMHILEHSKMTTVPRQPTFSSEVMRLAVITLNSAPMLSILFMAAQIAADWDGVQLPHEVQGLIYVCTCAVLFQVLLAIWAPSLSGATLHMIGPRGEVDFVTQNHCMFVFVSIIRWATMTTLYFGFAGLCVLLWRLNIVPHLMHLLIRLSVFFFAVYIALWAVVTLRQLLEANFTTALRVVTVAKDATIFCPILAVLFLCSWVHAHALTNPDGEPGEPQGYVQDYMCVATVSMAVMLLMLLLRGCLLAPSGAPQSMAAEKNQDLIDLSIMIPLCVVYISVAIIIVGRFTITPKTASIEGSWFI